MASTIPGNYSVSTGAWGGGGTPHHTGSTEGEWIQIQLPDSIYLQDFVIESRSETTYGADGYDHGYPKDVVLYGSINGSSWDTIKTFTTGQKTFSEAHTENVNETRAYKYFALVVNSTQVVNNTTQVTWTSIGQIRLFGVPEYDPEADGVDVKVTSYPNVPNTDWLEVYYDAKNYSGSGDVQDETGNNRNGTLDGVTYDSVSESFEFVGGNKITAGPMTSFPSGTNYTASMWFKVSEIVASQKLLFHFGHGDTGESFGLNIQNGNIGQYLWGGTSKYTVDNLYTANEWVHAVGTINGSTAEVYVNGHLRLSWAQDIAVTIPTNPYLSLGIHFNGEQSSFFTGSAFFTGSIANFRLFNRVLTSDEVWQLYAYQKEYFGHGDLSMTLKAGRLGIGTSEPRAMLDVRGRIMREYNPGEIIEELNAICDGSTVTVQSGSYTMANITAYLTGTLSHQVITGSTINYTPPPGTKRVYYRFWFKWDAYRNSAISHFQFQIDDVVVTPSKSTVASNYSDGSGHHHACWPMSVEYTIDCNATTDDASNGKFKSWTSPKELECTFRDYNHDGGADTAGYRCLIHHNDWTDGTGTNSIMKPHLTIRAIA